MNTLKIYKMQQGSTGMWSKLSGKYLGAGLDAASTVLSATNKVQKQSNLTSGLNTGYDAIASGVSSIPGIGTVIGGAMKIGGLLSDGLTAMGVGTDQTNTGDKILDSKFMKLTPFGLLNASLAKKSKDFGLNQNLMASSGYTGTTNNISKVKETLAGKKIGGISALFGAMTNTNNKISNAATQNKIGGDIVDQNNLLKQGSQSYSNYLTNSLTTKYGKEGMKLDSLKEARKILTKPIKKFQTGGKLEQSIIPEGALHARIHNLTDINPDLDNITKKGIPVVSMEIGGELIQSAEIEVGELILRKSITDKLEELSKDGSEEAMIEAGKLITKEIIENTDDKTNKLLTDED